MTAPFVPGPHSPTCATRPRCRPAHPRRACLSTTLTRTNLVPWPTCPGVIWRLLVAAIGRLFRAGFDLIYLVSLSCPAFGPGQTSRAEQPRQSGRPTVARSALPGSLTSPAHPPRSCRDGNAAEEQRQKCSTGLVLVEPFQSETLPLPCSPCSSRTAMPPAPAPAPAPASGALARGRWTAASHIQPTI